jgi:hypothetical protein
VSVASGVPPGIVSQSGIFVPGKFGSQKHATLVKNSEAHGGRSLPVVLGDLQLAPTAVWQTGWSFRFLPPPFLALFYNVLQNYRGAVIW